MPFKGKDAAIEKIKLKGDKLVRAVVFETLVRLAKRTRVDTGRLRNNWNVQAGNPNLKTTEEVNKDVASAITSELSHITKIRAGGSVFVTNGLSYAQYPLGKDKVVEVTAAEIRKLVSKVAAELVRE